MAFRKRFFLSERKKKELVELILKVYPFLEGKLNLKNSRVERVESVDREVFYLIDGAPNWIEKGGLLIPTINLLNSGVVFPKITVDMGAVPFVSKGADIMYPGIVDFPSDLKKNQIVGIVDERNKVAIAVGLTLIAGVDFNKGLKGKAVKNIHFVGDKTWRLIKSLGGQK